MKETAVLDPAFLAVPPFKCKICFLFSFLSGVSHMVACWEMFILLTAFIIIREIYFRDKRRKYILFWKRKRDFVKTNIHSPAKKIEIKKFISIMFFINILIKSVLFFNARFMATCDVSSCNYSRCYRIPRHAEVRATFIPLSWVGIKFFKTIQVLTIVLFGFTIVLHNHSSWEVVASIVLFNYSENFQVKNEVLSLTPSCIKNNFFAGTLIIKSYNSSRRISVKF